MSRLEELKKLNSRHSNDEESGTLSRLDRLKKQSKSYKPSSDGSDIKQFISDYESFMNSDYDEKTASDLSSRLTNLRVQYNLNRLGGLSKEEHELSSYLDKMKYSLQDHKNAYDKKTAILTADDFDKYTKAGAETANPDWKDTFAPLDILGWKPFGDGEKVNNMVTFAEQNSSEALKSSGNALRSGGSASEHSELINLINTYMTPEEKSIYNYYIGKGEVEKADEYLTGLTDSFRKQQAGQMVEQADGKALELLFSVVAGLDQFGSGAKSIDNFITGSDGEPTSAIRYAQESMSKNNTGIWKVSNDLAMNIGNMAPSMMVGAFTGGLGGALTLGVSAVGNTYSDTRKEGYSANQARAYATLVGASETLLQYGLGGISKLGGKVTNGAISKFVSGLDSALAKTAIKLGGSMASEGLEESIQTVLEPAFKSLATGTEYEAAEWDEILYSGLLGALSAGVLEGSGAVVGGFKTASYNREMGKLYGDKSQQIIDEALAMAEGSESKALAEKYKGRVEGGKNLKGSQINRLLETIDTEINAEDTAKVMSAAEARLSELGETGDIKELATALAMQASGEELSRFERNLIKNSKFGERVANELDPDNIHSGEYSTAWAENIGTKRLHADAYSKTLYDLAMEASGVSEAKEQNAVAKTKADFENATGEKFKASEGGKTKYEDADVTIGKVVSTEGGLKVELDNGKTVNARDVEFGSGAEALMYEMVARMEVPVDTANEILGTFKPATAKQAAMYFHNIPLAYKYGTINYEAGLKNINMSEQEKRIAFNRGKADSVVKAKENTKTAPKAEQSTPTKKNGIIFEDGVHYDESTANELQKASMIGIETIAQMSSLEVHVFESVVEDGERVYYLNGERQPAPNGYFKNGNKIYIDLNAGNGGEGAMLYTMSHEVAHYIRKWNAKGFKELGDFLIEQYGKNKVSVTELIDKQKDKIKARYEREGKALPSDAKLFDMAYEELVADAMSDMFTDPRAYEKLAKLKAQNKTLWQKLGEAIKNLLGKLKSALGIYKTEQSKIAVAQEAHEVRAFSAEVYEKLQDLYIKAFVEADANYSSAEQTLASNGIIVDSATESASLMSVRDVLDDKQRRDVSKALATRFGVTQEEALQWLTAETSLASLILNPKYSQYLDYTPDPNEVAIKQNSDYPQGTVDFSPICAKRREFTSVMNNILRLFPNHVFAATDLAKIRSIMQEEGMTIPCGICYVEDRRQLDTIVAQNFIDSLKLYREGSKTRPDGKAFNTNQLKGLSLIDGDNYTPSIYELVSLEGLNVLKEKNPNMAEAWIKFNNARGMQSVRLLANEAEYKRQILKYNKQTVKSKNDKGGLRVYSFSDAEMFHLIDIIQVITDSATVGLSLQGYTKVNEYARAVKDTGEKLNRSLIPKGELGYHIENGQVVLDYDTVEGIDINHPDFFDNKDNPNVGNITIGVSDVQIRAAMVSDFVDQIIPFHTGQSEEVLGEKGISTWSNYKDFQTEKDIATGKVSDHQINIYTEVLQVLEKEGKPINKRTFVEKFLQVCKDNGLTPRFSQFLNTNEDGEYVYTEGYHKMLVDFKTFAQTEVGEYLPQMPVKPIFDNEYITKILKDYVKSQKVKDAELTKSMPKVIERITNEIVNPSETKFSDRDSLGNELSAEQEEYFKDSKVRDKKGNLMVLYHGTTATFNTFKKGDVGFHFGTKGAARGRVGYGKNTILKEVYLNITNPIVFDEDLGSWDADYRLTKELFNKGILSKAEAESVLFTDDKLYRRTTEKANKKLAEVLLAKGYDGIAYENTFEGKKTSTSYIVFNSNQAKEITNKTPTANSDIRYSEREIQPITETEYKDLEKHFGVTGNFKVAGYLLPDGKMLDFSGKHWGDSTSRSRQVDHRDAQEVLQRGNNGINDMVDMIGSGSIRLMPETGGINLAVYPNEKQRRVLSTYINYMLATEGQVIIDYDSVGGDTVYSKIYEKGATSSRILSDIRNYFNGGRQSDLMNFHTMYSDRNSESKDTQDKITADMTEEERYEVLKNKKITAPFYEGEADAFIAEELEGKTNRFAKQAIVTIANKLGVIGSEINFKDVEVKIVLSNSNLRESLSKRATPEQIAKLLPVLSTTAENSVVIERHDNRYYYDTDTVYFDNLLGAYIDGDYLIPVRFGLKHSKMGTTTLYVVVDQNKVALENLEKEKNDRGHQDASPTKEESNNLRRSVAYSISQIIPFVNSKDLLRYIPDGMLLNENQRTAKWEAIAETIKKTNEKNDKKYAEYIEKGNLIAAKQMVLAAAKANGYNSPIVSHGTRAKPFTVFKPTATGVYLATNREVAEDFATGWNGEKGTVYDLLVNVEKPLIVDEHIYSSVPYYWNIPTPTVMKKHGSTEETVSTEEIAHFAKDHGYDGVIVRGIREGTGVFTDDYIVFEANQLKSADPITYDNNGNVIPLSERFNAESNDIRYSDRDPNAVSNRTLLANALESNVEGEDRNILRNYKTNLRIIESEQRKLDEVREQIDEIKFKKSLSVGGKELSIAEFQKQARSLAKKQGKNVDEIKFTLDRDSASYTASINGEAILVADKKFRSQEDMEKLQSLYKEAKEIEPRILAYDKELLRLERMKPIKDVLNKEKAMLRKKLEQKGKQALKDQRQKDAATTRELLTRYQESRKKAIEGRHKTEIRHKIKNVVSDLNKLLLNPTKDQHVPIGLQLPVAEALDAINMDTMNAGERVAYYNDLIAKSNDPDEIAMLTKKRDFFEYREANFKERITALKNAYAEFKESDDPLIRNAHNDAIEDLIKNTADAVGNKSLKDMSFAQLEAVYNMYKAILATVRNSNKLFKEGRQATVTENSESVKAQVKEVGGHQERVLKLAKFFKKLGWNMLKPVTAMKVIGSKTFAELFDNVRAAEDTWAVDVNEAKEFYKGVSEKYGYNKWDFKTQYSFKDSRGEKFSISLEQMLSLYAYSKREQADEHLEFGGFIFDDAIEVTERKGKFGIPLKYEVNDANPHRLGTIQIMEIISKLTKEQRSFVDEMQTYLSEVMGEKGNEVSLAMYDIKLYNEKNYFPLKTARYFREFDPEKSGTPKIKNSGFSKKTVPQAGNPIVLSNFMDVWASHVNDMSMYHAFVLPLEDFMRVYNYSSTAGGYDSVQQYIKNAYGSQANQYIEKLMDDLNGGARVDSSADIINKGLSLFKKASVFASASVVVQQPSAIARAMAYINPKYFVASTPSALNLANHKKTWAEVKKYAPVAVIKEMGYFDTGVGRSTVEWLKGNQTVKDKMDDVLSKAPAMADELCWTHIWEAVKKETADKNQFKNGSEDFLKECGRRFTEVITNTQVYDSVLSRSGMMRSKDTGMKMATAFMAEPTTTVNMMVDGIIQGKRGNKKFTAATVGAVSASIILNSILVALVYAARDDDEDETYTEKYIGSVTSELLDGFNPLTYVPFVKDIWSIAQGYDVERSDMSVVSNLWESVEGLFKDDKSGLEKVLDATGAASSLFGIPLKNLIRDARGMYNLTETILSDTQTTKGGIGNSIADSFKSSIPLWDRIVDTDSKSDNLYDAIMSGDKVYVDRLKKGYKTEDAYETAVRKALRENDSRINEAAQARLDGDIATYTRIAKEIIAEGYFSQDIVVGAINSEMTAIKKGESSGTEATEDKDEVTSIYKASDINAAFENGNNAIALAIIDDLIETKVANGMEEKNAKSSVRSSMTSYWKPLYMQAFKSGNYTEMARIRKILLASGLYGGVNDVVKTAKDWLKS